MRIALFIAAGVLGLCMKGEALAGSALCDNAARIAAREAGIPAEVMLALSRTETGRTREGVLAPWPWTVNMEGEGRWFEGRAAALAYVEDRRAAGARSFDIGCFQINHRWHGHAFRTIDQMFDPLANARYAARFLKEIRAESASRSDDWISVAGSYHSRTPRYAKIYRERFARILGDTRSQEPALPLFAARRASLAAPPGRAAAAPFAGGVGISAFRGSSALLRPASALLPRPGAQMWRSED